ncbi:MAG: hypothetical protein CSA26_06540 [Desulfobacterales bacterium]|nr:MAG: hypothetical protein CSA26_06540 [Desulfobacterales bacterium]
MTSLQMNDNRCGECGQAMVEFIIVFFPLFLFILLVLQTALLLNARYIVNYAAFSAARSAIVYMHDEREKDVYMDKADRAADLACMPIAPKFKVPDSALSDSGVLAGVEKIIGSGGVVTKFLMSMFLTEVSIYDANGELIADSSQYHRAPPAPGEDIQVMVTHHYVLSIPLINKLFFYAYWYGVEMEDILRKDFMELLELVGGDIFVESYLQEMMEQNAQFDLPLYWLPIKGTCTLTVEG